MNKTSADATFSGSFCANADAASEGQNDSRSLARLLRRQTRPVHERVEAQLGLLDPDLSAQRLRKVIEGFLGFWEPNESRLEEWSLEHPAEASTLRCSERRRSCRFAADLAKLGMDDAEREMIDRAPAVFQSLDEAKVLGWLYVTEGATLGGAMITRHLRTTQGLSEITFECFKPYPEGPATMWRSFTSELEAFARNDARRARAVTDAAVLTFEALERWLTPLAVTG